MSIRETFSNSVDLAVLNEYAKLPVMKFQQCFGTLTMLLVEGSSGTRHCRHLSDYVFEVPNFVDTKSMRAIFFFKVFKI